MKALSFGEMLWDIIAGDAYIGGAPFNLSAHLAKFGLDSYLVSSVGLDELGSKALSEARKLSIKVDFLARNQFPTGTVDVFLDENGMPDYKIHTNSAWDSISLTQEVLDQISIESWDIFSFGTLSQRSSNNRNLLKKIFNNINAKVIFYDVNLRQSYFEKEWIENSFLKSTFVKVNDEEAVLLSKILYNKELNEIEFAKSLNDNYDVKQVIITRGENGAAFWDEDEFHEIPGIKVDVVDTVGSGDSFSAAFLYAKLKGSSTVISANFANQVGSFVASKAGAVPEYSDEIHNYINSI